MPAAGSFRPGPAKKPASSYKDFFNSGATKPSTQPVKEGIRRTGAVNSMNASPMRNPRRPGIANATRDGKGLPDNLEAKAEALRRRLKKNARVKKAGNKVSAAMKAKMKR